MVQHIILLFVAKASCSVTCGNTKSLKEKNVRNMVSQQKKEIYLRRTPSNYRKKNEVFCVKAKSFI